MKSVLKKVILILILLILLFSINSRVFALTEIISDGKDFIEQADPADANIDIAELQGFSGYLYNILLAAGVVIAVIVATVLGVQFMMSGAEGQAKVKEMILPFVVGCIIVFGGFGFWKIALTVGENLEASGTGGVTGSESSTDSPTQYERDEDGNPVCRSCGDQLGVREQRNGECTNCGEPTGI